MLVSNTHKDRCRICYLAVRKLDRSGITRCCKHYSINKRFNYKGKCVSWAELISRFITQEDGIPAQRQQMLLQKPSSSSIPSANQLICERDGTTKTAVIANNSIAEGAKMSQVICITCCRKLLDILDHTSDLDRITCRLKAKFIKTSRITTSNLRITRTGRVPQPSASVETLNTNPSQELSPLFDQDCDIPHKTQRLEHERNAANHYRTTIDYSNESNNAARRHILSTSSAGLVQVQKSIEQQQQPQTQHKHPSLLSTIHSQHSFTNNNGSAICSSGHVPLPKFTFQYSSAPPTSILRRILSGKSVEQSSMNENSSNNQTGHIVQAVDLTTTTTNKDTIDNKNNNGFNERRFQRRKSAAPEKKTRNCHSLVVAAAAAATTSTTSSVDALDHAQLLSNQVGDCELSSSIQSVFSTIDTFNKNANLPTSSVPSIFNGTPQQFTASHKFNSLISELLSCGNNLWTQTSKKKTSSEEIQLQQQQVHQLQQQQQQQTYSMSQSALNISGGTVRLGDVDEDDSVSRLLDNNINSQSKQNVIKLDPKQCEECGKVLLTERQYIAHKQTHARNLNECWRCSQTIEGIDMQTHLDVCHPNDVHTAAAAAAATSSHSNLYQCQQCQQSFETYAALHTHTSEHGKSKPYECSICLKRFSQQGNLSCHLRIHSGVKPFACEVCSKTFRHSNSLRRHLRTVHSQQTNNNNNSADSNLTLIAPSRVSVLTTAAAEMDATVPTSISNTNIALKMEPIDRDVEKTTGNCSQMKQCRSSFIESRPPPPTTNDEPQAQVDDVSFADVNATTSSQKLNLSNIIPLNTDKHAQSTTNGDRIAARVTTNIQATAGNTESSNNSSIATAK